MARSCLAIVLAAGEGTRMQSSIPKVLHKIGGLPLVGHVLRAVQTAGATRLAVVVGFGGDEVAAAVKPLAAKAGIFTQTKRLGTAHAVLAARAALQKAVDDVLIVFGDTPLIEEAALDAARQALADGADIAVMGFHTDNPSGYGRLIEKGGRLVAIVEEKEATAAQKKITFCNGGLMAVRGKHLLALLDKVGNKNTKGEYYLTDIVALGAKQKLDVRAVAVGIDNVIGINTRLELAEAESLWQHRQRVAHLQRGVTMLAPESVYFSYDTHIAADVLIEPQVFFGCGVKIAAGAVIHAFSHIEGAEIGEAAQIGPFARLRPGARLAQAAKVGNFCEVKNAKIGSGAKVNHLTYIGDARIGAHSNIGAGTIICNYDGYNKWQTEIGENAFVGSNTALVAPVRVGNGAYIASGSVITENVADDALAFGRARQINKEGRAKELRARYARLKNKK